MPYACWHSNEGCPYGFSAKFIFVITCVCGKTKASKLPKMEVIRNSPIELLIRTLPPKLSYRNSIYQVGDSEIHMKRFWGH